MMSSCNIAVVGVGLIGQRHAELVRAGSAETRLSAIVDPSAEGREYAQSIGVVWHPSIASLFNDDKPDGVIIATPNQLHVDQGLECVAAACPVLVEKPIATTSCEAQKLVDAGKQQQVPILVGHHRRHNPLIQKARELIEAGHIGCITAVHSSTWFLKPEDYFDPEWRRKPGAGPVLINSIHDIDLLRYLCGEVTSVQALSSNVTRNFEVEDTAVALLRFKSGALGTLTLSDAIASPWSWEISSGENAEFPAAQQNCYMIGGTKGSLSVPDLKVWSHQNNGHWKKPISATSYPREDVDPLLAQIHHFVKVINGEAEPLVSAEEGLKSLRVVEALHQSALINDPINLF